MNEWQMGALQSLQGLFFDFDRTENVQKTISTINQFTQLKSLQLFMPYYKLKELNLSLVFSSLSKNLPNLEEVHLIVSIISDDHFEFVARSPKLSKLVFRLTSSSQIVSSYENVRDRMDSLIEMRDKLPNACEIVIYVCEEWESERTKKLLSLPWLHEDNLVGLRTSYHIQTTHYFQQSSLNERRNKSICFLF